MPTSIPNLVNTRQVAADTFGSWLQQRRTLMGLSRKELAEVAHFSTATIKGFELNTRRPSVSAAKTLAKVLCLPDNLSPAFMAFSRGNPPAPDLLRLVRIGVLAGSVIPFPVSSITASRFTVPSPVTPLLGRGEPLERADRLLRQHNVRLISVLGPPGVGKTRFSLELAHLLREAFSDGVFFVALAPLSQGKDIPQAVCDVILPAFDAGRDSESDALISLKRIITSKQILLILDNFEHVLDDATTLLVSDLLATTPGLKIVVTSRQALQVYGEHRLVLEPLSFPATGAPMPQDLAALAQDYPAVGLLVERAQARAPKFLLTQANASDGVELCAMLDGLPLALEIAASHLDQMTVSELVLQLKTNKLALQNEQRSLITRHQSLYQLIAHSYMRLEAQAQQVFCALSVFADSADDAAVHAVLALPHGTVALVRNHLHALSTKSLIAQETVDNASRFSMLETLRDYGLDMLRTSGQEAEHRRRHAQYFLAFAQYANDHLRGEQYLYWMDLFELNHNNCRAALRWCQQHDPELGLALATAWSDFWYQRGHIVEGFNWLSRLLNVVTDDNQVVNLAAFHLTSPIQAHAMCALAKFCWNTGPLVGRQVLVLLEHHCLPTFRQQADAYGEAVTQVNIGEAYFCCDQETQGRVALEAGLMSLRNLGRSKDIVIALNWLVPLLLDVDVSRAVACAEEALMLSRTVGDPSLIARSIQTLSVARRWSQDYAGAVEAAQEAVTLYRQIHHQLGLFEALIRLAHALNVLQRYDDCRRVLHEYLEIGQQLGFTYVMAVVSRHLGHIAYLEGNLLEALRQLLMSAARTLLFPSEEDIGLCFAILVAVTARLGCVHAAIRIAEATRSYYAKRDADLYPQYQNLLEEGLAFARQHLSKTDFETTQAEGGAMTLEQALREAQRCAESLSVLDLPNQSLVGDRE